MEKQHAEFELELKQGRAVVACSTNRPYRERMEITDAGGHLCASHQRGGIVSGIMARLMPGGENPLLNSLAGQREALGHAVRGIGNGSDFGSAAEGLRSCL